MRYTLEGMRRTQHGAREGRSKRQEAAAGSSRGLIQPRAGLELTAWGSSTPRPLFKTIVELHMEVEVQAIIHVETSEKDHARLVLSDCSNTGGSLRITLLHK